MSVGPLLGGAVDLVTRGMRKAYSTPFLYLGFHLQGLSSGLPGP